MEKKTPKQRAEAWVKANSYIDKKAGVDFQIFVSNPEKAYIAGWKARDREAKKEIDESYYEGSRDGIESVM